MIEKAKKSEIKQYTTAFMGLRGFTSDHKKGVGVDLCEG